MAAVSASARPAHPDTSGPGPSRSRGLARLTPTGRARVPAGWALYDFANTIFSYAVVSYAMGLWLVEDTRFGAANGPFAFSVAIAVSVGINAIASPILGALSDRAGGRRLPYLLFFTLLCIIPTAVIGQSPALVGLILFTIANFAYQSALIYYDATLRTVSYPETRGTLSGFGVAIGYGGTIFIGLLIFLLDLPIESVFFVAAALYGLFAIPLFLVVREAKPPPGTPEPGLREALAALGQLKATILDARTVPGLPRFLIGRFFYSDAVNTIIVVMAIVATEAMGLSKTVANVILLILAVVAVLASFGWGALVDRIGPKRTLMIVLTSWAVGLVVGGISLGVPGGVGLAMFLLAGAVLGSGLGGVQVSDRVLMIRLSPPEKLGEFFGLYGLVGKGSQVIGQLLFGVILLVFQPTLGVGAYQIAVLSLLVTMLIGVWLIRPVSDVWSGSGEVDAEPVIPDRLAPAAAPLEPR
jgi:MFS transporter, UMF1 family